MEQDVFQAISDPTRRKLLQLLGEQRDQELSIAALVKQFPLSRTAINKHLYILAEAELVSSRKVGRETRYRLRAEPLAEIKEWLSFFDHYWSERLLALQRYVEQE